jgi:hypothetical protein
MMMDIDREINEGLGGGNVSMDNGLIEEASDIPVETPPRTDSNRQ